MANVNRIITLTSKGNSSGPLYDVYYSTDCGQIVSEFVANMIKQHISAGAKLT